MTNIMADISPDEKQTIAEKMMSNMASQFNKQAKPE